jgi:hypothetical protein
MLDHRDETLKRLLDPVKEFLTACNDVSRCKLSHQRRYESTDARPP